MKTKIGINGFGRIGRNAFKIAFERPDLEIVAVNDLTDTKTLAHLLKHDSNYGTYDKPVDFDDENVIVDGQKIKVLAVKDPTELPWGDLGVQVVIESTGLFTKHEDLLKHIQAGAKKVVLSAPEKDDSDHDTFVIGVNEQSMTPEHQVFSNASCTTNCITPVMAILEKEFGIEKAMMTTVHSYTASQKLQDAPAKDLREARNAAENIVPTTTGASIAAAKALPTLEGIFGGMSVRVPTPVVSLSDFAVVTKKDVTVEQVNEAFKKAAADPYFQGILDATEDELVSSDYIGNTHSAIVDLKLTAVVGGNLVKVVAWYDNEWGYSNRLVELTADIAKLTSDDAGQAAEATASQPVATESTSEAPAPQSQAAVPDLMHEPPEPLLEPGHDPHPDNMGHGSLEATTYIPTVAPPVGDGMASPAETPAMTDQPTDQPPAESGPTPNQISRF
jgi:glyceraldehyde 3-phosphate dehydrogenase